MKKNEKKCKYCALKFPPDLLEDHYKVCEKKPVKVPPKPYIKPCVKPYIKPVGIKE